ncbi:MAG: hypothetical protein IPL61_16850 [Myxococcales bacterium]|nr:hypothetical protein [Myxococcales bacterium]
MMNVLVLERDRLLIPGLDLPDIDLRAAAPDRDVVLARAIDGAHGSDNDERGAWSVIAILAMAATKRAFDDARLVEWAVAWMEGHRTLSVLVPLVLAEQSPDRMPELLTHVMDRRPRSMAFIVNALLRTPEPYRYPCELLVVRHPDPEVREHFFALLGTHQRLVPPGSLDRSRLSATHGADVLRVGIGDPEPRVRERAIAVAYGIGLVADVRAEILAATDDPDGDVRCYALVALGVLDDAATRGLLIARLGSPVVGEVCAAIAALARRPDGVEVILAGLPDPRPWYNDAAFASIGEVATALDDAALDRLATIAADDRARSMLERHRWRTRHPDGREVGPDGRIEVVRRP